MKQEDKDILLRDLCARLPYGVKCHYYDCCNNEYYDGTIYGFERKHFIQIEGKCIHVEEVKPYLFPLSSMTDEQKEEYNSFFPMKPRDLITLDITVRLFDWLHKNHFDYRNLINEKLAIDCTNLNIY